MTKQKTGMKITYLRLLVASVVVCQVQAAPAAAAGVLVESGKFTEIYNPKVGEKEHWCINDHTFVYGPDQQWHVFGITHTVPLNWYKDPGKNLLHATAKTLTQSPWHKESFAVSADWDKYGEWLLWVPHVVHHEGTYYMFVCAGNNSGHNYRIHLLTSPDLWHWERSPDNTLLIDGFDGRDPMRDAPWERVGHVLHRYFQTGRGKPHRCLCH